jgi:hypothetical protein
MLRRSVIAAGLTMLALSALASAAGPTSVGVRVLVDNNKLRVRLLSFPAGYQGSPQLAHRADQLLVYLDQARVRGAAPSEPAGSADARASGSASWLAHDASAAPIHVESAFRAIDIELKHGTMSSPDPKTASLPYEQQVGGGAPAQTLVDNDLLRATLLSFPKDFVRPGNLRRHYDTLIVYIDEGRLAGVGPAHPEYAEVQAFSHHPDAPAVCDPIKDCDTVAPDGSWSRGAHEPGSVAWHPKDGFVGTLRAVQAYRALYVELKH